MARNSTLLASKRGLREAVGQAMRRVSEDEILPRFRSSTSLNIEEKSPGELVTDADREAELRLSALLQTLLPIPVVGEEATAKNPALLNLVDGSPAVWLVDPVDGTANFIAGSSEFAVMVALVEHGTTTASWILRPTTGSLATAVLGEGANVDGLSVSLSQTGPPVETLKALFAKRFLPAPIRARVESVESSFASVTSTPGSAGVDYPKILSTGFDVLLYWRTLPWDHAPGCLLIEEAGGFARRPDGSSYRPGDGGAGLLVGPTGIWQSVRDLLFSPLPHE